jgi:hypothetical protein
MGISEFHKKITDWLLPKGYVKVFANHPSEKDREFHFMKDGVRVICVAASEEYCFVSKDIMKSPHNLSLRTGRFEIGTDELDALHEYVKENASKYLIKQ